MEELHAKMLKSAIEEVQKETGVHHAPFEKLQRTLQLTVLSMATKKAMVDLQSFKDWQIGQFKTTMKRKGIPFYDPSDEDDYLIYTELTKA